MHHSRSMHSTRHHHHARSHHHGIHHPLSPITIKKLPRSRKWLIRVGKTKIYPAWLSIPPTWLGLLLNWARKGASSPGPPGPPYLLLSESRQTIKTENLRERRKYSNGYSTIFGNRGYLVMSMLESVRFRSHIALLITVHFPGVFVETVVEVIREIRTFRTSQN